MSAHSKIGASSYYRWNKDACPASVRLSQGIEQVESEYAKEGTRAHEMAANVLLGKEQPAFDNEMWGHVKHYVDAIKADQNDRLDVEVRFDLSKVYPGCFGTADAVGYNDKEKLLRVYDLKYGAGIFVDAENNDQLKYYGLGALIQSGFPAREIELVIVQPRMESELGTVRRWKFEAFEILDFAADLRASAKETENPNAKINPGEWCRFCPAAGVCPALHSRALEVAKNEFSPVAPYDVNKLADTLLKLDQLESFVSGVRAFAYAEAAKGVKIPGFKIVEKLARRKWRDDATVANLIIHGNLFPRETIAELFEPPSLKSVAQIEKIVGKKAMTEMLSSHVVQESSGTTLVHESDRRPEFSRKPELDFVPVPKTVKQGEQ